MLNGLKKHLLTRRKTHSPRLPLFGNLLTDKKRQAPAYACTGIVGGKRMPTELKD